MEDHVSDYTVNVRSDGHAWVWQVEGLVRRATLVGSSRRITDVEGDARDLIAQQSPMQRYTDFTIDVQLDNPYVRNLRFPAAVVCDIDGTLALHTNRGPFEMDKLDTDECNPSVASFLDRYEGKAILLSGRQEEYRPQTELWLEKYLISHSHLYMRAEGDYRSDDIVKLDLFDTYIRDKFNVTHVLDDRDRCVYLWRKLGLSCWQVAPGNF
jgi:hypothetical protein